MLMNQSEYMETISNIKSEIKRAQYHAMLGANRELILLYWRIGQIINAHKAWATNSSRTLPRISSWSSPVPPAIPCGISSIWRSLQ